MSRSAGDEYRARAESRRTAAASLERREIQISQLRLTVFAIAVLLAVLVARGIATAWWLLAPLVVFIGLAWRHDRTIRARQAAERAEGFYRRGLARLEDRWQGSGETGDRFRDDAHLYANDLDLFGRGSLFELLSLARTQAGEEMLASWLKAPAAPDIIRARHEAVRELTPALDLREALSLAGGEVREGVHPDELISWAEQAPQLAPPWHRYAAVVQTIATLATAAWALSGNYIPLVAVLMVQGATRARQHARLQAVLHRANAAARELTILAHLLEQLERQRFTAPRLVELRGRIDARDRPASVVIRQLQRLVEWHDWEHNMMFAPVAALLSWSTHLAWAIERWRARHGADVGGWLRAAGEIEALASLSAYRYEHPADAFPDFIDPSGTLPRAVVDGAQLGHPLLPAARMVRNDVRLGADYGLIVLSGSNMSGKSTLLRTLGVNIVLALAGAPVRAASLRLSPLAIGATLRIQDSLQEGRSRFYAEITRIRAIVDLARGPQPMLFLLDELFHGTNSHDRLVGASGVLRSLLALGAIGMITTHDLALTAVVDELAPRAINAHFEDTFDAGEIRFDYLMKPGPVRRSNALALMRAVGLDVDAESP